LRDFSHARFDVVGQVWNKALAARSARPGFSVTLGRQMSNNEHSSQAGLNTAGGTRSESNNA